MNPLPKSSDGTITQTPSAAEAIADSSPIAAENEFRSASAATPITRQAWRRRRNIVALVVVGLVLILLGGTALFFTNQKETANAAGPSHAAALAPVVTVTTVAAQVRKMDNILTVTGSINPWDELSIGSELGGLRIEKVNFEEGDQVKKGQVLVNLNSSLLKAQLAEQESMLKSNKANLIKSQKPILPEDMIVLKAALAKAEEELAEQEAHRRQLQVKLETASTIVDRFKYLATEGAKSDQDLEDKIAAQQDAELELVSAEHKVGAARRVVEQEKMRLARAHKGGRNEDVVMSAASVEQNEARIRHLQGQINQTVIRAPDDGLIVKRDAHIGDICELSKPLLTMIRLNRLELKAQANAADLAKFKEGQEVRVSTAGASPIYVKGKVRLVSPRIDPGTRLGVVHIDLPKNSGLKAGMFVRGEILLSHAAVLTVPLNSVVSRGGESFVFTLDGSRAISKQVSTGSESDSFVEIKSGLHSGQLVIDKGARFLSDRDVVDLGKH